MSAYDQISRLIQKGMSMNHEETIKKLRAERAELRQHVAARGREIERLRTTGGDAHNRVINLSRQLAAVREWLAEHAGGELHEAVCDLSNRMTWAESGEAPRARLRLDDPIMPAVASKFPFHRLPTMDDHLTLEKIVDGLTERVVALEAVGTVDLQTLISTLLVLASPQPWDVKAGAVKKLAAEVGKTNA